MEESMAAGQLIILIAPGSEQLLLLNGGFPAFFVTLRRLSCWQPARTALHEH
jgi:hypothetical protein